jgi:hypothetical protein
MPEIEHLLAGMTARPGDGLPPCLVRALHRTRARRRALFAAAPLAALLMVVLGLSIGLSARPAPPRAEHGAEAPSPIALVSLIRANRDPDPDVLRLPPGVSSASSAPRLRDADGLAAELALR